MNYDVQHFIDKFEAIPEEMWLTDLLGEVGGPRCANGHCMGYDYDSFTDESAALCRLFRPVMVHFNDGKLIGKYYELFDNNGMYSYKADRINNGLTKEYPQPTPKQRILAALYDIKAMTKDTGGKTKTVYVSVPVSITEQSKDLVLS